MQGAKIMYSTVYYTVTSHKGLILTFIMRHYLYSEYLDPYCESLYLYSTVLYCAVLYRTISSENQGFVDALYVRLL